MWYCIGTSMLKSALQITPAPPPQKKTPAVMDGRSVLELGILHARKMF